MKDCGTFALGAPQEYHVRIEYFEVVIHEMPCNIKEKEYRIQNLEYRIAARF